MKYFSISTHPIVKSSLTWKDGKSKIWNLPKSQLGQVELYFRERIRKPSVSLNRLGIC